jgi:hypothetical protein
MIQTSELLMGKVAVGVILPGAVNGHYSDTEVSVAYAKVRGAMDFWSGHAAYPGVRFIYDLHSNLPAAELHTTPPHLNNKEWVAEQMGELGYDLFLKGTEYGPVYEYLDSLRIRTRSEWGVVFFITKVSYFPGAGYTAYAYLGGPFLVVPSGTNGRVTPHGTGSMDLSHLLIHESGHLFWALDEYPPGGTSQPCHTISGYLAIQNKNSLYHDYTCDRRPVRYGCAPRRRANTRRAGGELGRRRRRHPGCPRHPSVRLRETLPDTITTVDLSRDRRRDPCSEPGFGAERAAKLRSHRRPSRHHVQLDRAPAYWIDDMKDEEDEPPGFTRTRREDGAATDPRPLPSVPTH